jgi:hypothetical protein
MRSFLILLRAMIAGEGVRELRTGHENPNSIDIGCLKPKHQGVSNAKQSFPGKFEP